MAAGSSTFVYPDLTTNRSTRVFVLKPSLDRDAPLEGKLVEIELDSCPEFWALSYAWDAEVETVPINCLTDRPKPDQRGILHVTSNCAAALQKFRDATEFRMLWVDSICISQHSREEKSRQVALMGTIYQSAAKVVVWLGLSDKVAERGMQFLERIVEGSKPPVDATHDSNRRDEYIKKRLDHLRAITSGIRSPSEDSLGPFFSRSWFKRMWTVQEVALPQSQNVEMYCGDLSIKFTDLLGALDLLKQIKYPWGRVTEIMTLPRYLVTGILTVRYPEFREMMKTRAPKFDLADKSEGFLSKTLLFTRSRLSTDPKDKIFSLYGILKELGFALSPPDYGKSVEEVYASATRSCIENERDITLLNYVVADTRRLSLPSWVPDWSSSGLTEGDSRYPVIFDRFASSGGSAGTWSFPDNILHLGVFGTIIDSVTQRAGGIDLTLDVQQIREGSLSDEELRGLDSSVAAFKHWVLLSLASDSTIYLTGELVKEALQRTLVNDHPKSNAQAATTFEPWYNFMNQSVASASSRSHSAANRSPTDILQQLISAVSLQSPLEKVLSRLDPQSELASLVKTGGWAFHSNALSFANKKSFFTTKNGYFGTAPDKISEPMREGDKIALIAGLSMPVLLRQEADRYRLISHCYVHGCMYGEAWREEKEFLDEITLV